MTDYTGKTVFVERDHPTKNHSSYYDGEYIVIRQTPNQLIGVALSGHYGLSTYGLSITQSLPLVGEARYRVVSVGETPTWVGGVLDEIEQHLDDVLAGRAKRQWMEYVYHRARVNLNTLRDVLGTRGLRRTPDLDARRFIVDVPQTGDVLVVVRKGTKVEVREL